MYLYLYLRDLPVAGELRLQLEVDVSLTTPDLLQSLLDLPLQLPEVSP